MTEHQTAAPAPCQAEQAQLHQMLASAEQLRALVADQQARLADAERRAQESAARAALAEATLDRLTARVDRLTDQLLAWQARTMRVHTALEAVAPSDPALRDGPEIAALAEALGQLAALGEVPEAVYHQHEDEVADRDARGQPYSYIAAYELAARVAGQRGEIELAYRDEPEPEEAAALAAIAAAANAARALRSALRAALEVGHADV